MAKKSTKKSKSTTKKTKKVTTLSGYKEGVVRAMYYDVWIGGVKIGLSKKECIEQINIKETDSDIHIHQDEDNLDELNYLVDKGLDFVNKKAMEREFAWFNLQWGLKSDFPYEQIIEYDNALKKNK